LRRNRLNINLKSEGFREIALLIDEIWYRIYIYRVFAPAPEVGGVERLLSKSPPNLNNSKNPK
jgi:hypothetical protein